jgi:hypothetical protein
LVLDPDPYPVLFRLEDLHLYYNIWIRNTDFLLQEEKYRPSAVQSLPWCSVVYESQLASIAGADLLDTLAKNMEELAASMAHGLDTSSLGSLQVLFLFFLPEGVISVVIQKAKL